MLETGAAGRTGVDCPLDSSATDADAAAAADNSLAAALSFLVAADAVELAAPSLSFLAALVRRSFLAAPPAGESFLRFELALVSPLRPPVGVAVLDSSLSFLVLVGEDLPFAVIAASLSLPLLPLSAVDFPLAGCADAAAGALGLFSPLLRRPADAGPCSSRLLLASYLACARGAVACCGMTGGEACT